LKHLVLDSLESNAYILIKLKLLTDYFNQIKTK
jgi:hypothetical protein